MTGQNAMLVTDRLLEARLNMVDHWIITVATFRQQADGRTLLISIQGKAGFFNILTSRPAITTMPQ